MVIGRNLAFGVGLVALAMLMDSASGRTIALNFGDAPSSQITQTEVVGDGVVKVVARGVGTDKDAALKDAYRDAVERAVGMYVDAEAMMQNDELVKDEVLTHSNAYVTHYDEIGAEKVLEGGLVQVRIVATVKRQALTAKLRDVMPAQVVNLNTSALQDAHAKLVSTEKRGEDAAMTLVKIGENWRVEKFDFPIL